MKGRYVQLRPLSRFAKKHHLSVDWLICSDLAKHPKSQSARQPVVMTSDEFVCALKQLNERDRTAITEHLLSLAVQAVTP